MYSLRSGGSSTAVRNGATDNLFFKQGRWRSEKAQNWYIKGNLINRLNVTQMLAITIKVRKEGLIMSKCLVE